MVDIAEAEVGTLGVLMASSDLVIRANPLLVDVVAMVTDVGIRRS